MNTLWTRLRWLVLGILLIAVPASAQITQRTGVHYYDFLGNRWLPVCFGLGGSTDGITQISDAGSGWTDGECGLTVTRAFGWIFNGTTYDRMRTASGDTLAGTGIAASGQMVWNGTTWDRLRAQIGNVDAITPTTTSTTGILGFNGTNWDRLRVAADNQQTGQFSANPALFDGVNYDVARGVSPANLTATTSTGIQLTAPVSTWSVTNTPGLAAQATASQAAGAVGVRHVATTVTACLAAGAAAQTPVVVNLRDGATGAGTVLRSWAISAPVNDSHCVDLSGLAMIGTAATAMTIEFAAAGVAGSQETVTLTGYSVQP